MLSNLQEYADKNGVEVKITATNDGVEDVVDEAYEYRNGDVISITVIGEEGESFTDVMTKTNKTIAMINGKHELVVTADGTQLDSLNTKLDDT
jgi:protein involved in polysaccharide export with SLBB domain